MDKNFKMTMSCYDKMITYETDHADVTVEEVMNGVLACMIGLTWHESVILKGLLSYLEDHEILVK